MSVRAVLVLLLGLALCAGCVKRPIYTVVDAPFPPSSASQEELAALIIDAGQRQGWRIAPVKPGLMRGDFARGRHKATVDIEYSRAGFSIGYRDSAYLKHDGTSIHEAYNRWVKHLETAIDREATFRLR